MANASFAQSNFLGGEWSQAMQGRFDLPAYRTSLNVCFNFIPVETGALVRRPGTAHAGTTFGGHPARVMRFDFEQSSAYTMEFADFENLQFRQGTKIVTDNSALTVTAISAATPAQITTSGPHGYNTNDSVILYELGATCPVLQNRVLGITKINSTQFTIFDPVTGLSINGAALGSPGFSGACLVTRVQRLGTPYTTGAWTTLRSVQAETTAFLLNGAAGIAPQALVVSTLPTSTAFAIFNALTPVTFVDGPYLNSVNGSNLTPSATSGSITFTTGGAAVPAAVAGDVGRLIRVFSQPPQWLVGTTYNSGDTVSVFADPVNNPTNTTYWQSLAGANVGNPPQLSPTKWTQVPASGVAQWFYGAITAVSSSPNSYTATLNGNLLFNAQINLWQLGVYGGAIGFPRCGCYHEGRLWLGGAVANRWDASTSNGINGSTVTMSPTDQFGNVLASSGISYTFNSDSVNPILSMIPDLQGIVCHTQAGEWLIISPTSGPITPTNVAARRVSKTGSANIEPVRTEHTILFVQRYVRKIQEYFADLFSGKFTAPPLNWRAKHLTASSIFEIGYQQELAPILWARIGAGTWLGCTYKRNSLMATQEPESYGFHRHQLGSGRVVQSICVGPSQDGSRDSLTMTTENPSSGSPISSYHVEVLSDIPDETTALTAITNLDNYIVPTSTVAAGVTGAMPYGGLTLNGLWNHNGSTVTAFLGGLDCGDYVVANGSITVPYGDGVSAGTAGGQFTAAFVATFVNGMPMAVGFNYTSQAQLVRPATPQESGARQGPALGKVRREHKYALQVVNTVGGQDSKGNARGLSIGTNFAKMFPVLFKDVTGTQQQVGQTFSGVYKDTLNDDYSLDGMPCFQVTRPQPAIIAAAGPFLSTQDE